MSEQKATTSMKQRSGMEIEKWKAKVSAIAAAAMMYKRRVV